MEDRDCIKFDSFKLEGVYEKTEVASNLIHYRDQLLEWGSRIEISILFIEIFWGFIEIRLSTSCH